MKVTYIIHAKTDKPTKVYGRFRIPKGKVIRFFTTYFVSRKDWSEVKGRAKPTTPNNKILNKHLDIMTASIVEAVNQATVPIDKLYIEQVVRNITNKKEESDLSYITDFLLSEIEKSDQKVVGRRKGVSAGTKKNYLVFLKQLLAFEEYLGRRITFDAIDNRLTESYAKYMLDVKSYSDNTLGRQLVRLKSLCNEAAKEGISVHPHAASIKGFTQRKEDRIIHVLTDEEIKAVKDLRSDLPPYLVNTRKLFLIGIYTGLRVSDLIGLSQDNIRYSDGYLLLDVVQQKTKRNITVPVVDKEVKRILEEDRPYHISDQKFNDYIKVLCKEAGITQVVEGNKRIDGKYQRISLPKYKFISSHSCRRTFCSMFYGKIPTAVLMQISGHSRESTFLSYINKDGDKDFFAKQFIQSLENGK